MKAAGAIGGESYAKIFVADKVNGWSEEVIVQFRFAESQKFFGPTSGCASELVASCYVTETLSQCIHNHSLNFVFMVFVLNSPERPK